MSFAGQAADLRGKLETLSSAFEQLRGCEALHTVLAMLLALGNALNAGTARADAVGFRLDAALAQIGSSRASSTSVLGFLARHARQRAGPELIGTRLREQLRGLSPACRLDPADLEVELTALTKDVGAVLDAVRAHSKAAAKATARESSAPPKPTVALASHPVAGEAGEVAASIVEAAAGAEATSAAQTPGAGSKPAMGDGDRFLEVMNGFTAAARGELEGLQLALAGLNEVSAQVCRFFCEEDLSKVAAHALLVRLHGFIDALVAAHDQAATELASSEARQARLLSSRAAAATPPAPTPPAARGGAEFEPNDSSLRSILEDDSERGDRDAVTGASAEAEATPTASVKVRRATVTHEAAATPGGVRSSPDELQKLFSRRATSGSMRREHTTDNRRTPGGITPVVTTPGFTTPSVATPASRGGNDVDLPQPSPGKRPRPAEMA